MITNTKCEKLKVKTEQKRLTSDKHMKDATELCIGVPRNSERKGFAGADTGISQKEANPGGLGDGSPAVGSRDKYKMKR